MMKAVVLLLCLATVSYSATGQIIDDGKAINIAKCMPKNPTRVRDCAPWGLNSPVNPAFQYSFGDKSVIDTPRGVINMFYFFKITVFGAHLETTVQMRALKAISEIMWNVNAHFTDKATDTLGKLAKQDQQEVARPRRRSAANRGLRERNIALAYGLAHVTAFLMPFAKEDIYKVLDLMVSDIPDMDQTYNSTSYRTAAGLGNRCALELISKLKKDGWNSEGDMTNGDAFQDYTGFKPANKYNEVVDPTKWQPLVENSCGKTVVSHHTTPQVRSSRVKPYAITRTFINSRKLEAPWKAPLVGDSLQEYIANAMVVINASAALTDEQKLIAEFFDKKIISFGGFERWYSHKNDWAHDDWIAFEQLSACFYDATILAWKEKIRINAIRPISAIRWLAATGNLPKTVSAWGGPEKGTMDIDPANFQSYMRTMPHSEYPSGTSCLCTVFVEWVRKFQPGDDVINLELNWEKGCSADEPGFTPQKKTTVTFKTLTQLHETCMETRIWAGVHFNAALTAGKQACSGVADQCFAKLEKLKAGIY